MILSVKKGMLAAAAFAVAAIILLSVGLSAVAAGMSDAALFTVVLDAGHGGIDGGVVGKTTGVRESDVNLAVTLALREDFEAAGFRVVLTRADEGGLYGLPTKGFKRRDMQKRKQIIEGAQPTAMISVHQNYFPSDPSRRGGQAFYRVGAGARPKHPGRFEFPFGEGTYLACGRLLYARMHQLSIRHRRMRLSFQCRGRGALDGQIVSRTARLCDLLRNARLFVVKAGVFREKPPADC